MTDPLTPLLKEWKPLEPRHGFDARILRRIHEAPEARPAAYWPRAAAAALAGILFGMAIGSTPAAPAGATAFSIARADSIAGAWAQLSTGDER